MRLIPISERPDAARILYDLLSERPVEASISHKKMPTWEEHVCFVHFHPYEIWYFVEHLGEVYGAIYLTRANEIGIEIFERYRGVGYGEQAVLALMVMGGPRRYLANINPANEASITMFEKLGFRLAQETYALECT